MNKAATITEFLDYLACSYDELRHHLARRLGSDEQATEALQDTWVRLASHTGDVAADSVSNPRAYLLRMAFNQFVDRYRSRSRLLGAEEIDALLTHPDPAPGPAETTEARAELKSLAAIIERLPARRRQILLAIRLEGLPQKEVAECLGVSLRLVQRELKMAQEQIAAHLDR
ncbi:RNA polymerase sigma factor [Pseudothauera rhizosphaerae]|uniref:Sigma-70 family RNA polymerase sigma factor n=1 Tax=Pseudothauera rhizosphaerae TaxID=2565932 RepID=A0A4V3WAS6_9RHOO|nr:sigma-70 family RNA polymerase sigma factor [Pseudothauera rhizosphaerae]THF60444.1 sigma-70 family RNA polymerase sigma factor [Pseudothauera rhizosphaerae]